MKEITVKKQYEITDANDKLLTIIGSEEELINYLCAISHSEVVSYDSGLYTIKTGARFFKLSIQLYEDGYLLSYHDEVLNGTQEQIVIEKIGNETYLINHVVHMPCDKSVKIIRRLILEVGFILTKARTKKYIKSI